MNRDISYILGLVSANEYEKLKQSVFRPGSLSLAESVFWYEENKNHPDDALDESILAAEIERFCEESEYIDAVKEAFSAYHIPATESTVGETVTAMKLFEELEEISDDVCARFLREGISPTLRNLHTLRFEKEGGNVAAGPHLKEGEQALAWTFPEEGKEDDDLIRMSGFKDDEARRMLNWLKEKNIYQSLSNLQMLGELWTLPLPYEKHEAAAFAAKNLRKGIRPCDGLVIEKKEESEGPGKAPAAVGAKNKDEEHLLAMEELFAERYIAKYGEEQYFHYEFSAYRRSLEEAEESLEYLEKYELPLSVDHLSAFARLLDREGVFPILEALLGEKELLALYEDAAMDEPHCKKVLTALWESFRNNSSADLKHLVGYLTAQKTLMLMELLEEKGFFEVPVKEGETLLRVRIRKEGNTGFTAVTEDESIGGLSMRYTDKDGEISLLAVGSREETLEELKKRTKGKVSLTTLYSPEFPYGKNFF